MMSSAALLNAPQREAETSVAEDGIPVNAGLVTAGFSDAEDFHVQHHLTSHLAVTCLHKTADGVEDPRGCR